MIMFICLYTFLSIILIKILLQRQTKLFQNSILKRNLVLPNYDTFVLDLWNLFIPRMVPNLVNCKSLFSVCVQNVFQDVCSIFTYKFRYFVISTQYFLIQLACVRIFKWKKSTNHCKQNNSRRPYIYSSSKVSFTFYHFWCSVTW